MNPRERRSYADALIRALVKTRDEFGETDNRLMLECLFRELPRLIDVNTGFDGRTKRARCWNNLLDRMALLRQNVNDYLNEFK